MNSLEDKHLSKFRKLNFYFGKDVCASCLGRLEGEAVEKEYVRPVIGVEDELLIPRGRHKLHQQCLQEMKACG